MREAATRRWTGALGTVLLLLSSGCFASKRPLGPPKGGAIDERLIATWTCRPPDKEPKGQEETTMDVAAFDETQYIVEWREKNEDGSLEKPEYYRVYSTRVGAETLLNVKELGTATGGGSWSFLRYRIEKDGLLHAWIVDDDAVGAKDDAGLAVIRKRVADEKLYRDFMTCRHKE